MRVALTMRISEETRYVEPRDSISRDWLRWCVANDVTPLLVPNIVLDAKAYLRGLKPDLLVLTGGNTVGKDPERDENEKRLLAYAVENRLPTFGVCRGMQLINVYFGGRLADVKGHVGKPHVVDLSADWRGLYGLTATVNSFHNETVPIDGLGDGLVAAATCGSGEVEALNHQSLPIAGVMWHPERDGGLAADCRMISALAEGSLPWR